MVFLITNLIICATLVGTLGFSALIVNGKHPRNLLFISNCAGEYGAPVIGVLWSSSKASASSLPPFLAFFNNF